MFTVASIASEVDGKAGALGMGNIQAGDLGTGTSYQVNHLASRDPLLRKDQPQLDRVRR